MSDDIQKETERIHQGIVESLSFSEALARRDAEIERLRDKALRFDLDQAGIERREREAVELVESRAEIERLNQQIESRDFLLEERRLKIEQLCAENECLDAEIERLRREHEKAWADAQLKAAEIALLKKRFRDLEQERRHLRAAMDLREKDHREKTAENERLRGEVALRKAQQSREPFCPDHRDKVRGLPCRECEIERLRGELRAQSDA